jgi:hypothetical protein
MRGCIFHLRLGEYPGFDAVAVLRPRDRRPTHVVDAEPPFARGLAGVRVLG